jgi:NADP-dependent 3-hydroxy acid dehydrogenase YdfG
MNQTPTIFVTGCTKGIGLAIVEYFAEKGFSIAGCARNASALEKMQQQFSALYTGQQFLFLPCDVSQRNEMIATTEKVLNQFGHIDILVNNAGTFKPGQLTAEATGDLENLMATNVYSAYHATRTILPSMIQRNSGHIFNMCSIASLRAYENGGSYSITKFALLGFSRQLRLELQHTAIKVTALLPGAVYTPSWEGVNLPESRFIPAADIANTIYHCWQMASSTALEEILIRPQQGDI